MNFYRYDDVQYADIDEWDNVSSGRVVVNCTEYFMLKETPCGYWIRQGREGDSIYCPKIWVSKTAKKRTAYPSKEEALTSFKARKNRQIAIHKAAVKRAELALAFLEFTKII